MWQSRRSVSVFFLAVAVMLVGLPTLAANQRVRRPAPDPKAPPQPGPAQPRTAPSVFTQGETLTYTATLNDLPAGEGEIRLRKEQQDGREVYRFTGRASSNEWVDYLYRRRDTAEAVFAANGFSPISFRLTSKEDKRQREYGIRYDPLTKALLGSVRKQERVSERSVPAIDVYDPVSALYLLRSRDVTPGTPLQAEVFTGRGHYRFIAQVVGREVVQLSSGKRPAIRLHPELFSLDRDSQKNLLPQETTVWVSADATHTPLKLESFIPIGRVVVELSE